MRAARISILLVLAGCNSLLGIPGGGNLVSDGPVGDDDDAPPPDGPPPAQNCELTPDACALHAVDRNIGQPPFNLTLDGTFGNVVTVKFPNGNTVDAQMVGAHRALVTVPDTMLAEGDISVTTAGRTIGKVRFRGTSYQLGLSHFQNEYPQTSGARQGVVLAKPRAHATAHAIGQAVHVLGGSDQELPTAAIETAPINADGTLGKFVLRSETLRTPRHRHASIAIGGFVHVLGGQSDLASALSSIERAQIGVNGTLEPFEAQTGELTTPRVGASIEVIGNGLFVFGGNGVDGGALASIERAPINPNGSLGPFAVVPGRTLATARTGHTSVIAGDTLFVISGSSQLDSGPINTIEKATISPDGTLSTFDIVPGVALAQGRSDHSSFLVGNEIFVIGGSVGGIPLGTVETISIQGGIINNIFTTHQLSAPRKGAAGVLVGDDIQLIGGVDSSQVVAFANSDRASLNLGAALDGTLGSPVAVPPRTQYASEVIGNSLFVFGGRDNVGAAFPGVERAQIAKDGFIGVFNQVSGVAIGNNRTGATIVTTGSFIHLMGGRDALGTAVLDNVVKSTIDGTGSPETFSNAGSMSEPREFAAAVAIGNRLYVFGGRNGGPSSTVEQADINPNGSISTLSTTSNPISMAVPRSQHCSAVFRDKVFLIGGGTTANNEPTNLIETCQIDPSSGTLQSCVLRTGANEQLLKPRRGHACAVIGNFLYAIGGEEPNFTSIERTLLTPDGSILGWTEVSSTSSSRSNHKAFTLQSTLFILGGDVNDIPTASAEQGLMR